MSNNLMQLSLDVMERYQKKSGDFDRFADEITALRQELSKPEQEPVAWRNAAIRLGEDLYSVGPNGYYDMTAKQWLDWALGVVNTAPPPKPWVGLTDDDHKDFANRTKLLPILAKTLAEFIEAKLKERNT